MEGTELPTTFLCHARKRHQVSNLRWQALLFDCPSRPKSDTLTHLGSRTQAAESPPQRQGGIVTSNVTERDGAQLECHHWTQ